MRPSQDLTAPNEIRAYLVEQLNLALRKPGMFGGELAIRMLLDHLLFVERRPEVWAEEQHDLEQREAWSALGAMGAFDPLLPSDHGYSMASVYAEIAHRQGWLNADRVLDAPKYALMRATVREWTQHDEVVGRHSR